METLPRVRVAAGSAVGCGCDWWWVRSSARSRSGAVLVAGFGSLSAAGAFASRWAGRLGFAVRVRRAAVGGWFASVPVAARPQRVR